MPIFRVSSIQKRLGFIYLAFLCLLVVSVTLTFLGLDAQKQDARVINLAGRQRMLIQQMNRLALTAEIDGEKESASDLFAAAKTFEETLTALRWGGAILDYTGERLILSPPTDVTLTAEMDRLLTDWAVYRSNVDQLAWLSNSDLKDNAARQIEAQSPQLLLQADRVVRAFEAASVARVARLRAFQLAFLLAGLILLSAGWQVSRISVVRPLARLEQAARRIGDGDLSAPVESQGSSEVQTLSRAMEAMRVQILRSQQDQQEWAATLENRVQQRTRELEALSAVSREINSHLSIEEVLTSVTEKARILLGGEIASLCLLDEQGKVLSLHAAAAPETAILSHQSPAEGPLVGQVLHQHCARPCGVDTKDGFCQILAPQFRASHLAAPLYAREKVIGALCVGSSTQNAFRPDMTIALAQLSDSAAVALENSRLYQQAEYAAALEERQRIASEMHDGLLQTLNFLRLMVGLLEEQLAGGDSEKSLATMGQIRRAQGQAEREIRQAIESLQVDFPLNDTLQDRLHALSIELSSAPSLLVFENQVTLPLLLSRQESEQVLRICREAVLNSQRHARAGQIGIKLEKHYQEVVLSVRDDGTGFIPEALPQDGRMHFGLKIMQGRAARLGGELAVYSNPGAGTVVELRWTPGQQKNCAS